MKYNVSICIPSYKRAHYLKRLLDSIAIQSYKDFEVVVSDDSDDNSVSDFLEQYQNKFEIRYFRNTPSLGTPANWMAAMQKANGEWIKLMHDDDWFSDEHALADFVKATAQNKKFIFSGRNDYHEESRKYIAKTITTGQFDRITQYPFLLYADNILGPPTILMFHHSVKEYYDVNLKWLVDIEYYIRMLQKENAVYINKPLINMSINDSQVTQSVMLNPAVVIPESFYLLRRYGLRMVNRIILYDAWWRMFRNLKIGDVAMLKMYSRDYNIPAFVKILLAHQKMIGAAALKIGVFSKLFMSCSYLINYRNIKNASL